MRSSILKKIWHFRIWSRMVTMDWQAVWRMVENVEGVDALLEDLKNHTFAKKDAFTVGEVFTLGWKTCRTLLEKMDIFATIFRFQRPYAQ